MEIFLQISGSNFSFGIRIYLAKVLNFVDWEFSFTKNSYCFILSWVTFNSAKQIYSTVFRIILNNFSALEQVEVYLFCLLANLFAESFNFRVK